MYTWRRLLLHDEGLQLVKTPTCPNFLTSYICLNVCIIVFLGYARALPLACGIGLQSGFWFQQIKYGVISCHIAWMVVLVHCDATSSVGSHGRTRQPGMVRSGLNIWSLLHIDCREHHYTYLLFLSGICIIGDFRQRVPNAKAMTALTNLIQCGVDLQKLPRDYTVQGHCDVVATSCPGSKLMEVIQTWTHYHRPSGSHCAAPITMST